ncbi:WXG100 family type VII secretion target [Bacillus cereus group sp. MYBK226-2]|uniref:WXG100 family type VII secretion target n=1 Tax=Bacillus cereus group sp. MYBK226-2 TaxID=3450655 RepID=UPI003F7988A7
MVQIKVTPEMLEEVANRASNTRIALESIHNNLCNEIDHLCFQWIGASNQQFVQMFNDARPKAFTSISSLVQVEEDLKRIAEKFRNADNQDVTMEEGAMCGKPSSEEKGFDGGKLARDITGELTGEYDLRRVWDGVDPSTGEKISWLDRVGAGGMMVLGITPVGKLAKVAKGAKMTAKAVESAKAAEAAKSIRAAENYKNHLERQDKVLSRNGAYRKAKRDAGIPNSTPHQKPVHVYDGTSENRWVEEYTNFKGQKRFIVEHQEDKMGRGPHFHIATDRKGNPMDKGRYNQLDGHYPEDFVGYKKQEKKIKN